MEFPRTLRLTALILVTFISLAAVSFAGQSADGDRKILVKTAPIYPTLARSMNIRGVVKLEAVVLPNGVVKSVEVKGGHPLLTQSAVTAVGHWKFEPASHETRELIQIEFGPQ